MSKILERINKQQEESKNLKDIVDYLIGEGVTTVYIRELKFETNDLAEVSASVHLSKESRDNYYSENQYNFKVEDYEISILELKKVLNLLSAVAIDDSVIVLDKYAKDNLKNNKTTCFSEKELNWSKDNIKYFTCLDGLKYHFGI